MSKKFRIRLKHHHDESGKTAYAVAKALALSHTTVMRYIRDEAVDVGRLDPPVIAMAQYYGCDWRDVVEVVEIDETDPENKTLLAAPA